MRNRLLLAIVAMLALALAWRACRPLPGAADVPPPAAATEEDSQAAPSEVAPPSATDAAARAQALGRAGSVVHAYLAALAGRDLQRADRWWANGGPGRSPGDAVLRALGPLRSLKINPAAARALDADPVPRAVEVPVRLRLVLADGSLRRVHGYYRLRASGEDSGWEITSAELQPELD